MEPIDRRITAAQLLALREQPDAERAIAALLETRRMEPIHALQTKREIEAFIKSGDATYASQLIHIASVRRGSPRAGFGA